MKIEEGYARIGYDFRVLRAKRDCLLGTGNATEKSSSFEHLVKDMIRDKLI
jgi:hypothetical protein